VSMQRYCTHIACTRCTKAINTQYREEIQFLLLLELLRIIVVEGDSCMKKDQSATTEKNRRRTVQ
jgi:hypothetical protein